MAGTSPAMTLWGRLLPHQRGSAPAPGCRRRFAVKSWGTAPQCLESQRHPRHLARPWRLWSYRLDDPAFRGLRCRGAFRLPGFFQLRVFLGDRAS